MRKLKQGLIALLIVMIAGCGGGGGSDDSSSPPAPKNEWDNMNWDQGQWA